MYPCWAHIIGDDDHRLSPTPRIANPLAASDDKTQNLMRSEEEIYRLILSVAKKDDRIRAVVLNGSRANDKIKKDSFQDFDILFLVNELESFNCNPNWIDVFGERIIFQTPNSMKLYNHDVNLDKEEICYLMLFKVDFPT